MNYPATHEGRAIWSLAQSLHGQWRHAVCMDGVIRTGLDMTAALAMAEAQGISRQVAVTLLPAIE